VRAGIEEGRFTFPQALILTGSGAGFPRIKGGELLAEGTINRDAPYRVRHFDSVTRAEYNGLLCGRKVEIAERRPL
jgi:hypothetical protein